ncbi:tRNA adenosine(34) deaminase TadA [Ostreibacterium oceani]|uniref:tRNA-specific adenosine deaminase n=1 Tax=Ostreibacterium oceani TaxID=2654998 RepID=A0A6N7EXJ2_9GAMM|nr:tRNA adenosine(34) deaminase TadA [Ostreibacterium oceani]MPV86663.1 tRNA adenosine(34) deaminase TadA [Ostreibacterium oceani]
MQLNNQDAYWMDIAIKMAEKAQNAGEVPVGAVLVSADNECISVAANGCIGLHDPTAHAEVLALRQAGQKLGNYRLPGTTLYVTLEPCPMCTGALVHARVARLVFAAKDLRTGACGSVFELHQHPSLNHKIEAVFAENSAYIAMLKAFFKARR